ncbi:MAG: Polyamine aminopropyltransferase [Candidatus Anoxychlamydiales bacterium]|nr:Polyamine aminopropyltransferase [Candidatus Anoxychlamydiales bacterium]
MTMFNQKKESEIELFKETLYDETWQQVMKKERVLFSQKSKYQQIEIFENLFFKKVLVLDNIVQTTEKDEFIYHEMLTHMPIFAHGSVNSVLIIGGGDGGILREVLRHKYIKKVVMVEIDSLVIDKCKEFMPSLSNGAFDNPRSNVIVQNAIEYIKSTNEKFDLVICDSTDPVGPGLVLFLEEFYKNCKRVLNPAGILVTQNGVPLFQKDELKITYQNRKKIFTENSYYFAPVPSYIGGFMAFGWASDKKYEDIPINVILTRFDALRLKMKYYNPYIHKASFAMPEYIKEMLI